jgi:antitoxin CptB
LSGSTEAAVEGGADPELKRLRWRCRRGMRELDVLLERYLRDRWPTAPAGRRQAFVGLLELPDPELAALCLQGSVTPVAELAGLIAEITDPDGSELSVTGPVYNGDFGCTDRPKREP